MSKATDRMIRTHNLTRYFKDFAAVSGLSFEVPSGAICALLGPNGSGKSTTLQMLTTLLPPSAGSAEVDGLHVTKHAAQLKRRIGVLPENLGLFDDLTVLEHIELTGRVYGVSKSETKARAEALLDALDLTSAHNRFAGHCSHGMRKKTALAMAILPNPRVLFLDEPFEGMDPVTSRVTCSLFQAASSRGVTVFLTSHILSMVEDITTHVLILRGGQLAWNSRTSELPDKLESLYFDLTEPPALPKLEWFGVAAK